MTRYYRKLNENRLTPAAFRANLWSLASALRLHTAAAIWTSDGYEFCRLDEYHPDVIMRFLFSPSETELAKEIQDCIGSDLILQDDLDSIFRMLKPRICNYLLVDASKLADNIEVTRQAQQYESKKEKLPCSLADIGDYSTKLTGKTCENISSIAVRACKEGSYQDYQTRTFDEDEVYTASESGVYTAVMMAVLTWISRLTETKTAAWEQYEDELRECIAVLADDFRRAVAMAQNPTNYKKTQDKLNVLQQENDLVDMSTYENVRIGMRVKDVGNTRILTHDS